jgi:hypothetical protein
MQRILYKRKIIRTFNLWQLNLTKLLSAAEFPLHFWNWILPSSGIRSCNSDTQKDRKNQIFYPLFHTFSKNYILKSEKSVYSSPPEKQGKFWTRQCIANKKRKRENQPI